MVNAVTEASQQGKVLIVIDNIPETPTLPLATWCPALGVAAGLTTSRRNLALSPEGITPVTVPPLTLQAAIELLTRQIDSRSLSDKDWRQIADEWVGRFPFALELLHTTLQAGAMTPLQLLKAACDRRPTIELDAQTTVLKEVEPQGMLRGVTEAFQVSYEQLSPEAQKAAHLLAQLAPDPIPEILLKALGSDFPSPAVRTMLRTRSIIMSVSGSTVPVFGTIHRVLADFLRSQPGESDQEIQILSEALQTIMTPQACRDPDQWALMTACMPHCEEILIGLQDLAPEQHGATIVQLRLCMGTLLSARGLYGSAREQEEQVFSYARTNLGDDHPHTLTSMGNLASTLSRQGDYAGAVALQRTVLERTQRILGEEHPSTSISAWNYLNSLFLKGDTETGLEVLRQHLLWLLERDPSTLGGYQQQIRRGVIQLLERTESE